MIEVKVDDQEDMAVMEGTAGTEASAMMASQDMDDDKDKLRFGIKM